MDSATYDAIVSLSGESQDDDIPPFHTVGRSEEDILEWLNQTRRTIWKSQQQRSDWQLTNEALSRGEYWDDIPNAKYVDMRLPKNRRNTETRKVTINDVYHYVDGLTAKLNRFRPGILVSPFSGEFQDRDGARVAKRLWETYEMQRDLDGLFRRNLRRSLKHGESWTFVEWDEKRGSYAPRWLEARKKHGETAHKYKDGWVYDPKDPKRIGDLHLHSPLPWMFMIDPQPTPERCQFCYTLEYIHKDEIKSMHPKFGQSVDEMQEAKNAGNYNEEDGSMTPLRNHLLYVRFWHRKSKKYPDGLYIEALPGKILSKQENPYSCIEALEDSEWGDLPIERLVYLEQDGQLHGDSAINFIVNLLHSKNKLVTMFNRNLMLYGHPKFLLHRSAKVAFSSLVNDATIVEWSGQQPPQLVNFATVPQGLGDFYKLLTEEADKIMRSHPVSSGTPPPGIKAGVALRLLEEIEDQQLSTLIKQQNRFTINVCRRLIAVCGKYFKKDDKRLLHIVGEDNQDLLEEFDPEVLQRRFNIRIESISQQARSPAARQQQNIELLEASKGNPIAQERIIDAMELVQPEKLTDPAVAAVSAAEAIYEICAQDDELPPPREGVNYMVYWEVLMAKYQRRAFERLPETAQERFRKYMMVLEYMMDEHTRRNPVFGQQLMTRLPGFPAFYHAPPPMQAPPLSSSPPQQGGGAGGAPGIPPELLQGQDKGIQPAGRVPSDQLT